MTYRRARQPGTYVLLLELPAPAEIEVGRLGRHLFPAGWYAYAGSALSGLEQRVGRHFRPSAVRHWHIDYLRAAAAVRRAWLIPSAARLECVLAQALLEIGQAPVPRFGASDCRCPAHLVRLAHARQRSGPPL